MHVSLLRVEVNFLRPFLLLLFYQQAHLSTFVFQYDKLLMLGFHRFLVLPLFELKFAELLFSDAKFTAELTYLLVIVTMSI